MKHKELFNFFVSKHVTFLTEADLDELVEIVERNRPAPIEDESLSTKVIARMRGIFRIWSPLKSRLK